MKKLKTTNRIPPNPQRGLRTDEEKEILLSLYRIFEPTAAELPMTRIRRSELIPAKEDAELLRRFYLTPKSSKWDETWSRKLTFNNLRKEMNEQISLAQKWEQSHSPSGQIITCSQKASGWPLLLKRLYAVRCGPPRLPDPPEALLEAFNSALSIVKPEDVLMFEKFTYAASGGLGLRHRLHDLELRLWFSDWQEKLGIAQAWFNYACEYANREVYDGEDVNARDDSYERNINKRVNRERESIGSYFDEIQRIESQISNDPLNEDLHKSEIDLLKASFQTNLPRLAKSCYRNIDSQYSDLIHYLRRQDGWMRPPEPCDNHFSQRMRGTDRIGIAARSMAQAFYELELVGLNSAEHRLEGLNLQKADSPHEYLGICRHLAERIWHYRLQEESQEDQGEHQRQENEIQGSSKWEKELKIIDGMITLLKGKV